MLEVQQSRYHAPGQHRKRRSTAPTGRENQRRSAAGSPSGARELQHEVLGARAHARLLRASENFAAERDYALAKAPLHQPVEHAQRVLQLHLLELHQHRCKEAGAAAVKLVLAGALPQAREAHPASQLLSLGPRRRRSRSCWRRAQSVRSLPARLGGEIQRNLNTGAEIRCRTFRK